jgi:hypothetical protein
MGEVEKTVFKSVLGFWHIQSFLNSNLPSVLGFWHIQSFLNSNLPCFLFAGEGDLREKL